MQSECFNLGYNVGSRHQQPRQPQQRQPLIPAHPACIPQFMHVVAQVLRRVTTVNDTDADYVIAYRQQVESKDPAWTRESEQSKNEASLITNEQSEAKQQAEFVRHTEWALHKIRKTAVYVNILRTKDATDAEALANKKDGDIKVSEKRIEHKKTREEQAQELKAIKEQQRKVDSALVSRRKKRKFADDQAEEDLQGS